MRHRQFRVLYRDFLFRIVDRELLSTYANGDASQLLLQMVALLVFVSVVFSIPALAIDGTAPSEARLMFAWSIEHFLIATTMLVVGVFAVLSWDGMFPGHQDVLVLAPLPIRAQTILLAKLAAVATALGVAVFALHVAAGVIWPLALTGSAGHEHAWIRILMAYWFTMTAAGIFVCGAAMSVQGIAASLLPRRYFLRVSSLLQLAAFCLIVGVYCLQPIVIRPRVILAAQQGGFLASSPSYWFLGLFQALSGSPALAPLARSAWLGLGLAIVGSAAAYGLSYLRTLRRIAEQPDLAPSVARARWLPAFGDARQTALVQFSVRTLLRSAPHRVIPAFYWGMGFALAIVFLKSPRGQQLNESVAAGAWQDTSVPLLVSSIVMMGVAVLAARIAFAMPRDLQANWIFRIVPVRGGPRYVASRRRALIAVSAAPVWTMSAIVFLWMWPWQPAAGHLAALAFLGVILVEIALSGTQKIPFTCSYLPGQSRMHVAVYVGVVLLLPLTVMTATFERDALQDPISYAAMLCVLVTTWIGFRWRTGWLANAMASPPEFDDEPAGHVLTLDVWDSRFVSYSETAIRSAPTRTVEGVRDDSASPPSRQGCDAIRPSATAAATGFEK
jgi:hypothetical protein